MSKIETVPFKNHLDQVLNPGDRAIAVVCDGHNGNLLVGRYLGLNKSGNVRMQVKHKVKRRVHSVTGTDFYSDVRVPPWPEHPSLCGEYRAYSPAYYEAYAKFEHERQARADVIAELQKEYVDKWETETGNTTLQLNKIYPAWIALDGLSD